MNFIDNFQPQRFSATILAKPKALNLLKHFRESLVENFKSICWYNKTFCDGAFDVEAIQLENNNIYTRAENTCTKFYDLKARKNAVPRGRCYVSKNLNFQGKSFNTEDGANFVPKNPSTKNDEKMGPRMRFSTPPPTFRPRTQSYAEISERPKTPVKIRSYEEANFPAQNRAKDTYDMPLQYYQNLPNEWRVVPTVPAQPRRIDKSNQLV